jgi:hypothetical protein
MSVFYFAWVDENQTSFESAFEREDEVIRSAVIEHTEGGFATLTIEVENPLIGLLAPGRKSWAWFSYEYDSIITPVFFGQLVGIPTDLLGKIVTLVFIAKPKDYKELKQNVAGKLKKLPFYDPIFLDPAKRDDPDAILEGYSQLYDINRVTHEVTTTDVLVGEDGMETFQEDDVSAPSLQINLGEPPLRNVTMNATVGWTQSEKGTVDDVVNETVQTYTGDGIIGDWPDILSDLGGGWQVNDESEAHDNWGVDKAQVLTYSDDWKNERKEHVSGDTMSFSWSFSDPMLRGPYKEAIITQFFQSGFIDKYGDPQVNIPQRQNYTFMRVPLWSINLKLNLRYEAARQRSERVKFTLRSNLQSLLIDDDELSSEIISLNGGDVGLPVIDVLNWLSVKGKPVDLGTVIIVEDEIDGISYQIATTAGTAGTTEPNFSEILGTTTSDGSVVWTSLGPTLFSMDTPDWRPEAITPLGEVILPEEPIPIHWDSLVPEHPAGSGANVDEGLIVKASNGSYQQVTSGGTTDSNEPDFSTNRGDTTSSGSAVFTSLGTQLPGSTSYQICIDAGTTGEFEPAFASAVGATTEDGSVTWASLGVNGSYIDKPIGNSARRSYFPIERGLRSIEYLINLTRARLRMKARAVEISFDCRYERALELSCRKNATVVDRRLPGGFARGKIIAYSLISEGDTGVIRGNVTIGCSIGYGELVTATEGTPDYADADLFEPGVQEFIGSTTVVKTQDLTFSHPSDEAIEGDDLVFPLRAEDVVITKGMQGASVAEQGNAIESGFVTEGIYIPDAATTAEAAIERIKMIDERNRNGVAAKLAEHPNWYELELKPLVGGPFDAFYEIDVSLLSIPKMIDLEAPST